MARAVPDVSVVEHGSALLARSDTLDNMHLCTPYDQEIAVEPGSDDFHTYFMTSQSETLRPVEQIT
jgi:hypothetical protein